MTKCNELSVLNGEVISAVCFVMDYVEFHFNGPILRCLTSPSISTEKINITFEELGSRDALCHLIGTEVTSVTVDAEVAITIILNSNQRIIIPLDEESREGYEAVHFLKELNGPLMVW